MKAKKLLTVLTASVVALTPVASNAAASLSIARAAPTMSGASHFEGDESNHGGGSTAVILGVLLIVLIGVAAISRGDHLPKSA